MSLNTISHDYLSTETYLDCLDVHKVKVTVAKITMVEQALSIKTTEDKWYQEFTSYKTSRNKQLTSHRRK